jgi:benzil reductase ((S)-benzoin forming)
MKIVNASVATEDGRRAIEAALPPHDTIEFLIHNAGVLEPVKPLHTVTLDEFQQHMATNVEGPLFLTQLLLQHERFNNNNNHTASSRILHISSGAAHKPYSGWGAYCTSKAALFMMYRVMDQELQHSDQYRGIRVGSVRPGVVDTPMQDYIRTTSPTIFPDVKRFVDLKQNNQLLPPETSARFIRWLLTETTPDEYAANEWDIRDSPKNDKNNY